MIVISIHRIWGRFRVLNLQKYITAPIRFLGYVKNRMTSRNWTGWVCPLAPALAITNPLSSSFSQLACSGKSDTRKNAPKPIRIVTMPSRIKTHLQLCKPLTPSMLAMPLASRPPKALAVKTEHQ